MNIVFGFFRSSLGKKYIVAITGIAMFGFVVAHMVGNLQVFMGSEQINAYGHFLQSTPEILWPARIGLLIVAVLHIWAALSLAKDNTAARPVAYGNYKPVGSTARSRWMVATGVILAGFIIFHILHFTVQVEAVNLTGKSFKELHDPAKRHDVYGMMILGFSKPIMGLLYVASMAVLFMHLSHGGSSLFQSLGWRKRKYARLIERCAVGVAAILFLGYSSIPVAILLGIIK